MASLFKVRIPETLTALGPGSPRAAALTRLHLASCRTRTSCRRTGTGGFRGRRRSTRRRCRRRQRCTSGTCPSTPRRSRPTSSSPAPARSRRSSWGSTRTPRPPAASALYCARLFPPSLIPCVSFPLCSCAGAWMIGFSAILQFRDQRPRPSFF
jgi:hypothetical protein